MFIFEIRIKKTIIYKKKLNVEDPLHPLELNNFLTQFDDDTLQMILKFSGLTTRSSFNMFSYKPQNTVSIRIILNYNKYNI